MSMKEIASFNVNGIRARLPRLLDWLKEHAPDVVVLQEIKSTKEDFPIEAIESLGYNIELIGQKSFNGVAVLSKRPIEDVKSNLPGDADDIQARWLEFYVENIKICNLYLPNGNPVDSEKYKYKLAWINRFLIRLQHLKDLEEIVIVTGDFNIIPKLNDCASKDRWENDAIFQLEVRLAYQKMLNLGFTDAIKTICPNEQIFTYWDYQGRSWEKNDGVRIDHSLLSPHAADKLAGIKIYSSTRDKEKPSDHIPISVLIQN